MAITTSVSTKELERVASLAYEGQTVKVMLCSVGGTGYDENSTIANWQTVEVSSSGYAQYSAVIPSGSYDSVNGFYKIPSIAASFTATGTSYTYDRVVIWIDGATYPHSIVAESPNIVVSPAQTQTYSIQLITDD